MIAAGGGLAYETDAEFREALLRLFSRRGNGAASGRAGRPFVKQHYTWLRPSPKRGGDVMRTMTVELWDQAVHEVLLDAAYRVLVIDHDFW